MTTVSVEVKGAEKVIKDLNALPKDIQEASESALSSVGFFISGEVRKFMLAEGDGDWPKIHPLTAHYQKQPDNVFAGDFEGQSKKRQTLRRTTKKKSGLSFLGNFARYRVVKGQTLLIGFASKKRPTSFDNDLEKTIGRLQKGYKVKVSPDMQAFLSAATEKGNEKGIDFFPLKKNTTLVIDPRPIEDPMSKKIGPKIQPVYERKFVRSLGRKNDFADREFRKGQASSKEKKFSEVG